VVASGQFLLDSEASLRGIVAPPAASDVQHDHAQPAPTLHEAEGRVMALADARVKIAHGPFHTLGMPGMTMAFAVADAALLQDIEVEDRVRFAVRETDAGLLVERIQPLEKQP